MKEVKYDELEYEKTKYDNLKGDTQVFHMWEPLKFEIKDNYQFICKNNIFNLFSNLVFHVFTPVVWILNKVLFGFRIENKENMRKVEDGKVTISNHIHPMDCTMNALVNFPCRTYFTSLASNFKIPVIRHLIRLLYAVPIPNKQSQKVRWKQEIKQALKEGKTVHFYPEGALWPYYEKIREFKKGAFQLAVEANVPIVPIFYQFEEPEGIFSLYKKKKCIYAKVLEPVYPNINLTERERILDLQQRVLEEYQYDDSQKEEMDYGEIGF